ncbi:MAG: PAS domain S-box protein [Gallionella sp.]|nr:PAS domain S-box protein [Gallionella sp.]
MPDISSQYRPGRKLKYSTILLIVVLLAYTAYLVSQSWRVSKTAQTSQLATIAALSENSVDIYLTELQLGMQNLGAELDVTHAKPDMDRAYLLVSRFQSLRTELKNVMLIRGDGQLLLTGATPYRSDLPTLAEVPEFKKIRDELQQGSPFAIGQPLRGQIDQSWVVPARYAVTDGTGKLSYIISANLPVEMLQRYWVDSITPAITALGLVRDDGYMVSRYPEPDADRLEHIYGKPIEGAMADYLRATTLPQPTQLELRNSEGKLTGLVVMRRLQHFPLTLFVEMSATKSKAVWWHDMHAPYVLMALVLAGIFALYSLMHGRAWSMQKRREELRRHYEVALQARSQNELFMFDPVTLQLSFANDQALEELGYTLAQLQQKTILELHPETAIEAIGAMLDQLRSGEQKSIIYQTIQMRANGSSYPVEITLQLIKEEEGIEELLAIAHDITSLKQAEENILKFYEPLNGTSAVVSKK